jgi:hypothetical protein
MILLVSRVETFGTTSWAEVAGNVPGRSEDQCRDKWKYMSRNAATTDSGAWTVEEKKKLVSMVDTFGTTSWANIAANVPGRNTIQCSRKWQNMSKKATATATYAWTVEEEKKLASAVETYGSRNWHKIVANVPGRNVQQCSSKWKNMSRKPAATAGSEWTVEEEKKLVSGVETLGTTSWAEVARNVLGRSENQCSSKWQSMSRKAAATATGAWTVDKEKCWYLR